MSAIEVVKKLRSKIRETDNNNDAGKAAFGPDYAWGTLRVLEDVDINTLPRQQLRNHLLQRDLSALGSKKQLVERLEKSVREEKMRSRADAANAEFVIVADLEERGSVYTVGSNNWGQLGLGDTEPRQYFTVVPETRGAGVDYVHAGYDITYAVTEDHDVLVWGGGGVGPVGTDIDPEDSDESELYLEPQAVKELIGEEIVAVTVGASHAIGTSRGGDVYAWGRGESGQLGVGGYASLSTPTLVQGLQEGAIVCSAVCGKNHSFALTTAGVLYAWGHGQNGRLGIGTSWRAGVPESEKYHFPTPVPLQAFSKEFVRQVSCGPTFAFALTNTAAWSWGSGDGGVLGLGDVKRREVPTIMECFQGSYVMQISCGTWHAAAVVLIPPVVEGGYVYTWGSGYQGQLGQGDKQVLLKPAIVQGLVKTQQFARSVSCGPYHNAVITIEGDIYTWGSNKNNCLGRTLDPPDLLFTPNPGHVGGFGALVDGIGRGLPRSVACGKEYTVVATYPYEGPIPLVAKQLMDQLANEEEELRLAAEQMALQDELERDRATDAQQTIDSYQSSRGTAAIKLCTLCSQCPGFKEDDFAANMCAICQHSASFHTRGGGEGALASTQAGAALKKI